jgi:hypothetical protein
MAAEYNSIQFNSQKNITIKEMWEKKRKDQIRTQNVMEFGLKMPTSPGLSTSNNWGWAETLKNSFTLVELGPLHKNRLASLSVIRVTTHSKRWVTTHSKQEVSDNTLKTRSEWQHTQEKSEHYSSRNGLQEDHEGSSWENREKLDWA